jgi:putative transposase
VTISKRAGRWFIAYLVDFTPAVVNHPLGRVGVDIGIKTLATLSKGDPFPNVRPFKRYKRKLAIAQRALSRKVIGSNNYKKAAKKVAKLHYRVSCIRKDAIHKLTHYLTKNHSEVVIEDLNVSGMLKNHRLANAIADSGFYEFKRQLIYKTQWYGGTLYQVDRFYPSSKTCCECKQIKEDLKLSDRVFKCNNCGFTSDRDLNASINLEQAVSFTVLACGAINKP